MSIATDMIFPAAEIMVAIGSAYAVVGVCVALSFLFFGLDRIDPAARESYVFRALIFPGLVLLWPVVVWRWTYPAIASARAPVPVARHIAIHACAWICLAVIVPGLLAVAFLQSRVSIPERSSTRLEAPQ